MSSLDKAEHEVKVFKEFVAKSGLPIDAATIESREPDEPDIRRVHDTEGPIAFELVQLTSPEIAKNLGTKTNAPLSRSSTGGSDRRRHIAERSPRNM
jgi:hypothetical protein